MHAPAGPAVALGGAVLELSDTTMGVTKLVSSEPILTLTVIMPAGGELIGVSGSGVGAKTAPAAVRGR